MFVGSINAVIRKYMANVADSFAGRDMVVGCSGNFTFETVLAELSTARSIHSNDISFYTTLAGRWLTGDPLVYEVVDADYEWLSEYQADPAQSLASVMVLMDMLKYDSRKSAHAKRMWKNYREGFTELVEQTVKKLSTVPVKGKVTSYYAGDVFEHFKRFDGNEDAIYCCFAPTYAGGYERMYKRLDSIVKWAAPSYELLDDARRDALLAWMKERRYIWYDDRLIDGWTPLLRQDSGRMKTVYLYTNVVGRAAYFTDHVELPLPNYALVDEHTQIRPDSQIGLAQIKTSELSRYKDAYLGKNIKHGSGTWAFAVVVDGKIAGFIEYSLSKYEMNSVYMMADFAVPGTRYARLSKLIVMMAKAGETKKAIERKAEMRVHALYTTAFTDRAVSMKYRGVLELEKRGETADGQAFLNYGAKFDGHTHREVLSEWLMKHGSNNSAAS